MPLTPEQTIILNHVTSTPGLTLVDSVAGSGKTTLLVAIANNIPHTNGLYMAYNASVAKESKRKFPSTTHCMTTHSLAYAATVKPLKLSIGVFTYKEITERLDYDRKQTFIAHFRAFCLSAHTSFAAYADEVNLDTVYIALANKYLNLMQSGQIDVTHEFYLKLFHMLLANGELTYDPFDFIMLDEAGDLNAVTLEIFKLLPSTRKIAVGDKHQNIYIFNDTINCFKALEGQGTQLQMTKSFRVSKAIASRVQTFCRKYLDPTMSFVGTDSLSPSITSRAFITRTNAALVARMIQLNSTSTPYGLTRKASEIFKVPLMVCNLSYQGFITDPSYKFLQADVDDYYETPAIREDHPSLFSYLSSLYPDDVQLSQAFSLVQKYRKSLIVETYEKARLHEKGSHPLTIGTAYSMKGAEYDEVTISDDLNDCIEQAMMLIDSGVPIYDLSPKHLESLNLYYVACTRCSKVLLNARHL